MKHKILILTLLLAVGTAAVHADVFRDRRRVEGRTNSASARELNRRGADSGLRQVEAGRAKVRTMDYNTASELNSGKSYAPISQSSTSHSASATSGGASIQDYRYGRQTEVKASGLSFSNSVSVNSPRRTSGINGSGRTTVGNGGLTTVTFGYKDRTVPVVSGTFFSDITPATGDNANPWQDANEGAADPGGNANPWLDPNEGGPDPAPIDDAKLPLALLALCFAGIKYMKR